MNAGKVGVLAVRLTALQQEELLHKLSIVEDEDDLLDSYGISAEQAADLSRRIALPLTELSGKDAEVLAGEVDNLIEIALGNMDCASDQERREAAAYIGSMRRLHAKLVNARTNDGADEPTWTPCPNCNLGRGMRAGCDLCDGSGHALARIGGA